MMKKMRAAAGAAALLLAFALVLPAQAATPGTNYETDKDLISVGGVTYQIWTSLYYAEGTTFRGSCWVCQEKYLNQPAGYLGASNYLCSPTGKMYAHKDMSYSMSDIYFHFCGAETDSADASGIYSGGKIAVYNGTGYVPYYAPTSRVLYPSAAMASGTGAASAGIDRLALSLEDGQYPVTASGETYGSVLLADRVGAEPDLILAEGIDGTTGYVSARDLTPDVSSPAEALEYMAQLERSGESYREIPLYDLDKNVIGTFRVELPDFDEGIPEEVQAAIGRLNAGRELPRYSRNSKGETYGIIGDDGKGGVKLDLLAAIGTEGQDGYIRLRDTHGGDWRDIRNPEEALRYMESLEGKPEEYLIPLYDCEGNVIGEFRCGSKTEISADEIYAQVGYRVNGG